MLSHPLIQTCVPQVNTGQVSQEIADQQVLDKDPAHRLVVVDGAVSAQLSSTAQLPEGVFIGSLQDASDQATVDSLVSHGILLYRIGPCFCVWSCDDCVSILQSQVNQEWFCAKFLQRHE